MEYIPLYQLAATSILALMSVVVAIFAATISYRQHFGFKPLGFSRSIGLRFNPPPDKIRDAIINLEFWNRRKYPIKILSMTVRFKDLQFDMGRTVKDRTPDWSISANGGSMLKESVVEPGGRVHYSLYLPLFDIDLRNVNTDYMYEFCYYDPIFDKEYTHVTKGYFRFTLSEAERKKLSR